MKQEPRDPKLDRLDALVGAWDTESTHPLVPGVTRGTSSFEWLFDRRFLVWKSDNGAGIFPSAMSIIGGGDTPGVWPMQYFDERGVTRLFHVSFEDGILKAWRDHPGFSQRFTGTFEDNGRTLRIDTELQQDGPWKSDLRSIYRRK